mmetsp:Transcript_2811/g.7441  ORF Transcript_2811/g.7441 Transcript_2811/m.7441 type:complete len:398 (-) Transcript_2811:220-1413(-)
MLVKRLVTLLVTFSQPFKKLFSESSSSSALISTTSFSGKPQRSQCLSSASSRSRTSSSQLRVTSLWTSGVISCSSRFSSRPSRYISSATGQCLGRPLCRRANEASMPFSGSPGNSPIRAPAAWIDSMRTCTVAFRRLSLELGSESGRSAAHSLWRKCSRPTLRVALPSTSAFRPCWSLSHTSSSTASPACTQTRLLASAAGSVSSPPIVTVVLRLRAPTTDRVQCGFCTSCFGVLAPTIARCPAPPAMLSCRRRSRHTLTNAAMCFLRAASARAIRLTSASWSERREKSWLSSHSDTTSSAGGRARSWSLCCCRLRKARCSFLAAHSSGFCRFRASSFRTATSPRGLRRSVRGRTLYLTKELALLIAFVASSSVKYSYSSLTSFNGVPQPSRRVGGT